MIDLRRWAGRETWGLTVEEAEQVAKILAPIGGGAVIDGDDRPGRSAARDDS